MGGGERDVSDNSLKSAGELNMANLPIETNPAMPLHGIRVTGPREAST